MATRNLLVRAGFDASGMARGTRQANNALRQFGQNANRELSSLSNTISSSMGKIGKLLAGAFAIGAIVNFGKECIELGSDLAEVQNVVDVTFKEMAEDVNQFAKTAITQFGLSETSAKKYTSTMGAMLKSMGLTTKEALVMSKTITGLSADMASFYNLDNEVAFEKIRSGISGETEPLKELGINMSVANMEAYALSQGITKAYSSMTQQEQALLRYNYLLSVTADAQGDFARTSDQWANQTRILAEQFNALKAEIGQGLIAAFTPVIRALNFLIAKLRVAAGYFRAFMELIFGKQSVSEGSGMADVASDVDTVTDSADGASDAVSGIGDSAKEAAKKIKGSLASFDELNVIGTTDSSSGSSSSGSSGGAGGLENMGGAIEVDLGETTEETDGLTKKLDGLISRLNTLKDLFVKGFKLSFETADLDALNNAITNIKTGFINVFGDGTILSAFNTMIDNLVFAAGATVGAWASMGVTIATNLVGGIGIYLNENAQYIKDRLISIFNVGSEVSIMWSSWSIAFADIFSAFGSEAGQQITANLIGTFANGALGVLEVSSKLGRDIMKCIIQPIVDNKSGLKKALEGTLEVIEVVSGTLKDLVTDAMKKVIDVYDQYLAPAFEKIESGISKIVEATTNAYNTYIQPTLLKMAKSWDDFYNNSLKPVVDKALTVFGKLIDGVAEIWDKTLAPFVAWAIDKFSPSLGEAFDSISEAFKLAAEIILGIVDNLLDVFDGIIDFLVGTFTGDWGRSWEGIKKTFKGIVDTFDSVFKDPLNKCMKWMKDTFVKDWENRCNNMSSSWSKSWETIKNGTKNSINWIIDKMNSFIRGINNKLKFTLPDIMGGAEIGFSIPQIPKLAKGGVLTKPTIVEAGEYAGARSNPEIVTPQNLMYDTVMSANSELATSFFNAARMIVGAIENKDLNVSIGDDAIGRSSVNYINRQTKIKGISPIML